MERTAEQGRSMHGKRVIVTGANAGIGKATAEALCDLGAHVILACRSRERAEKALSDILTVPGRSAEYMLLDLADLASVRRFVDAYGVRFDSLDVLINNAGVLTHRRRETADGYEMMFGVNYLGHFLLTMLLLPRLAAAAQGRILVLSSIAHKWTDIDFDDLNLTKRFCWLTAYGKSKLCNLLFCRHLSVLLEKNRKNRITINAVHPGIVASDILINRATGRLTWLARLSRIALLTPAQGAETSVFLASDKSVSKISGQYFSRKRIVRSSKISRNPAHAARLFAASCELTNLPSECIF